MLNTLANQQLGMSFFHKFTRFMEEGNDRSEGVSPLSEAMEQLHGQYPVLAADAHKALMTITLLAIPMRYADRIDVDESRLWNTSVRAQ